MSHSSCNEFDTLSESRNFLAYHSVEHENGATISHHQVHFADDDQTRMLWYH